MSSSIDRKNILVIGAGNFGTCLGQHLAENGHNVLMWTVDDGVAEAINKTQKNPVFLNDVILSKRLTATNKISKEILDSINGVVIAIPTQAIRDVLGLFRPYIPKDLLIVCAAKGIDVETLKLANELIEEVWGEELGKNACFLSGPSFAIEVIHKLPTAVSVASYNAERCVEAQKLFHANHFRVYRSDDPIGLEVAGALKNIIAIASGATAGLGFQANSRAALLTRGLAEITRVGVALGANPLTFNGLGGVGDLFLTCTSEKSRNYTVGYRLGKGESLKDIMATMGSVAEGVSTTKAARKLSKKLGVSMPIADQVYEVLYEGKAISDAVEALLTRDPKAEVEFTVPKSD